MACRLTSDECSWVLLQWSIPFWISEWRVYRTLWSFHEKNLIWFRSKIKPGEDQKSMAAVFGSQDLEKTWGIRCYPHSHAPEVSRYLSISGLSWNNGPVLCILWESSMGLAPPEPCRSRKRSGAQMLGQSLVSCIPWVNFIHFDPLWSTLGLSWCQLYPICGLSTEDLCGGRLQTFLWEHHKDLGERLVRVWTPPGWEAGQAAPCPERERAERLGQRFANYNCLPFGAMFSMFRYVWDMFAVYFLERR